MPQRRAERIESERHVDLFADLNLGASDDDDDGGEPEILHEGIGRLAGLVQPTSEASGSTNPIVQGEGKKKRRKKKKKRVSPWADQCMYAELLEMTTDASRRQIDSLGEDVEVDDGLPTDLETAWVAVAPVPAGKRCLAICHQGSGAVGVGKSVTFIVRNIALMRNYSTQYDITFSCSGQAIDGALSVAPSVRYGSRLYS